MIKEKEFTPSITEMWFQIHIQDELAAEVQGLQIIANIGALLPLRALNAYSQKHGSCLE